MGKVFRADVKVCYLTSYEKLSLEYEFNVWLQL